VKIGIVYDAGAGNWDPKDVATVVDAAKSVRDTLRRAGHETTLIPVALGDVRWLARVQKTDLIFNLCEGVAGLAGYEDFAVAAMDLARIPFTGATSWTVTIAHRKHVANTLLHAAGVPVPRFALVRKGAVPADLTFPIIVKPAAEDASVGIESDAVCTSKKGLRDRLVKAGMLWGEVMVQEYVAGREFNVGFIGDQALPLAEIEFREMPEGCWPILTYAAKWETGSPEDLATVPVCPAKVEAALAKRVIAVARQAWELLAENMGYGRIDLRVTPDGEPFVLEVNPNPDISDSAGLSRMAAAKGWDYDTLILKVVEEALTRSKRRRVAEERYLKISA
jgi:D-alanine-D-alanine ligase